jgi:methylenetetrahydrofolate dehydrogenase (NADP+) / methenyltetrahydrofolate cyclohydrolase
MNVLDGKKLSETLMIQLSQQVKTLADTHPVLPKLVVVLVGQNPASQVYVRKKAQMAQKLGILSELLVYDETLISEGFLKDEIQRLNGDPTVHGILIQLPLPKNYNTLEILSLVHPNKDVDGFHPLNLGKLLMGKNPTALPCTPKGIMTLFESYEIPLSGKHAVVVGRSNIVGKPMGILLLQQNATVTYCHSQTKDLRKHLKDADIIVAATGLPEFITGEDVNPGVVVIDVGINRNAEGKLVGDVHYDSVSPLSSAITPVPGGVGPMTIATLMQNTVALYLESVSKK